MIVNKISRLTGKKHSIDLPITEDQLQRWRLGFDLIQNIFPNLTPSQREYIKTGITEEEWKELF